jgi:ubiquinone/menaquinone biosynthesis C-methylase UbiE
MRLTGRNDSPDTMRPLRTVYYDLFSKVYDRVIELHSRDKEGRLRQALAERTGVGAGGAVLDLCTGTGAVLPALVRQVGPSGLVIGLDFSMGMLEKAAKKVRKAGALNCFLVMANAAHIPFGNGSFDAVTCSHAFYELQGSVRDQALAEIERVLRPGGVFCMMEHELPANPVIRFLFAIRMMVAGGTTVKGFLAQEMELFARRFDRVRKEVLPGGSSKVITGQRRPGPSGASRPAESRNQ